MNYTLMHFLEYLLYSNVHFTVTSARRTPDQNKACNGAPTSQHLVGEAIDMKPYGSTSYSQLGFISRASPNKCCDAGAPWQALFWSGVRRALVTVKWTLEDNKYSTKCIRVQFII